MAERQLAVALAVVLATACAEDELGGSLGHGECSPGGKCADGYECDPQNQCVPAGDAGADSGTEDAKSDAPCANCPSGFVCCDEVCTDESADPAHCGSCTNACPGTLCQAGTCTNECQPGFADCNKNVLDGCEAAAASCPADAAAD